MRGLLEARQGAGAGSAYVATAFAVSGALTYAFQSLSARSLGPEGYGGLAILWSATFLTAQVLWIGTSQTLGRYVAERETRGEDWRPVASSVRHVQALLLAVFLLVSLLASPVLTGALFGGDVLLTAAFVAAVAAYAPEYFSRGAFGGRRQFVRLGALHVVESSSRTLIAVVLLVAGAGVAGPAAAIVLAPLVGVLLVRPTYEMPAKKEGEPFSAGKAFGFAGPVLVCVAGAQAIMNGGPALVSLLGGTREQAGLLLAALILARAPQYVLSPAIAGLLPQASRVIAVQGTRGLDGLVARAAAVLGAVGVVMIMGIWLFGEPGMRLLYGPGFEVGRETLVVLSFLAASYLVSELLSQALFALGRERLAAFGWSIGLLASILCLTLVSTGTFDRVVYSLALGAFVSTVAQTLLYLGLRSRPKPGR